MLLKSCERAIGRAKKRHEDEQRHFKQERKHYMHQWAPALSQWPGYLEAAKDRYDAKQNYLDAQQAAEISAIAASLYTTDYKPAKAQKRVSCSTTSTQPPAAKGPHTKANTPGRPWSPSKAKKAAAIPVPYGYFPKDPSSWTPQLQDMLIDYTCRRFRGTAAMAVLRPDLMPKWNRKPPVPPQEPYKLAAAASSPLRILPKPWQIALTAMYHRVREAYASWKWFPGIWPANPSKSFLAFVHGPGVKHFEHEDGYPVWELKRQPPGRLKLFELEEDVMDAVIQKYWTTS
jgi:hypothetical protein